PIPEPPAPEPPAPEPPAPAPAVPFPAALAGRDVEVIPGAGAVVALTFDAGANAAGLPSILQTLAATGVRGTFFLTGNWAAANPAGVAAIVAGGHRLGNHSMSHPGFTGLSAAAIGQQLSGAEQAIRDGGGDPRPLFRFPFGERDARTIAAVNAYGYLPVRWTVDTLGWKGSSGGITAQIVADRVLAGLRPGEIVLMHIGSNPDDRTTLDADALPGMIERIRQAGYGFTTLDALLR
ncbi:polysaccharide deacetylase family protein, partial [Arthrobacter sp. SO3]|uniref:polysaccharide deacetylase family protein n=1 Tax=Arthrobacter sp. SO3 TaxID=1897057 RepID=UPI001CFF97A3